MYLFWPAVVAFVVVLAIGLARELILWRRDHARDARYIQRLADAYIRSLEDEDRE